jgi:hypothetical protein
MLTQLYISGGAGIILIVAAVWLGPLELDANTIFTLAGAFLGLIVGQWVLGRKNLQHRLPQFRSWSSGCEPYKPLGQSSSTKIS